MKTILITGGLGFIGSNFIQILLTDHKYKDVKIINIDNDQLNRKNHKHLQHLSQQMKKRYQYKPTNICNLNKMQALIYLHRPDKIVHFAAQTHVDFSIQTPQKYVKSNIVGTMNMLIASSKYYNVLLNDQQKKRFRFHHVSTDQVFGDFQIQSQQKFTQNSAYKPSSPYSATKAGSDMLVMAWARSYGLPISISNCSNNYGKYQDDSKLIPKVIKHCINNQPIPIHGSGLYVRDWIHVKDHCYGILSILQNLDLTNNKRYLFGGDCQKKNIQIINMICDQFDKQYSRSKNQSFHSLKTYSPNRVGQDKRYAIDNNLAKKELNWNPRRIIQVQIKQLIKGEINR